MLLRKVLCNIHFHLARSDPWTIYANGKMSSCRNASPPPRYWAKLRNSCSRSVWRWREIKPSDGDRENFEPIGEGERERKSDRERERESAVQILTQSYWSERRSEITDERYGAQFVAITPARGYLFSIAVRKVSGWWQRRNNFVRRGSDGWNIARNVIYRISPQVWVIFTENSSPYERHSSPFENVPTRIFPRSWMTDDGVRRHN